MATYSDDFNRADSTTLGSPWVESAGAWHITSNRLAREDAGSAATVEALYNQALATDHYAQAKVYTSDNFSGRAPRLLVRYADSSNSWIGGFEQTQGEWQIYRRTGGTLTKVATATYTAGDFTSGDTLRVESEGNVVRVKHNGATVLSHTDATGVGANRTTGIRSFADNTVTFDDWECGDLSVAVTGTGAVTLPTLTAAGSGAVTGAPSPITGTGAVTLPTATAAGSGLTGPPGWPAGLVSWWDFTEASPPFASHHDTLGLSDGAGSSVTKSSESGPWGTAASFDGSSDFLTLPAASVAALDVASVGDAVTVCAWVRRDPTTSGAGFVGGLWQEDDGDPRRQYGLFVDLPTYGGDDRVCGHISSTGGASPGLPYSRDYSATARPIVRGQWRFMAFTYDGAQAVSYLDGCPDSYTDYTEPSAPTGDGSTYDKNPYAFTDGLNDTTALSDFTVGANRLTSGMANYLRGEVGGLAVFARALTQAEIMQVHRDYLIPGEPVFREPFGYPGTTVNRPADMWGWRVLRGSSATDASTSGSCGAWTTVTGEQYMYRSGADAADQTTEALVFFPSVAGLDLSDVTEAGWALNSSHAADGVRFCVRVGSSWYATDATYTMAGDGATGGNWATAEAKTVSLARTAALWRDLTAVESSSLSLSGSARGTDVPDGELTAVGWLMPATASGHTIRIRDLTVTGATTTGTGAVTMPTLTAAGVGTVTPPAFTGTGAATMPQLVAAGTGAVLPPPITGTGAVVLPLPVVAGVWVATYGGTAGRLAPSAATAGRLP